jgi:hypothetical protein
MNNIKKFNEFLNESESNTFKLKDILSRVPLHLVDIYTVCKNEINISDNDIMITQLYTNIYCACLLQHSNLINGGVDIIPFVRSILVQNSNINDVKRYYKVITKPTHELGAYLLKMLTDYKSLEFADEKLKDYIVHDEILRILREYMTDAEPISKNYRKQILNAEIIIK